ncbi:MAG: putative metal-binding motif-containing protein, partial [Myxococcota bacterium]|nr:putative metal-binding motif-containing protein [Myxococcota bacterium]
PWYPDADNDGYGDASSAPTDSCTTLSGFVANNSDCNDADSRANPQGQEVCSGTDNDCDGLIDEADPSLDSSSQGLFYTDEDGDGYGGSNTIAACSPPSGSISTSTDCNDSDPGVNPGATEVPGDGIDNDCTNDLPTVESVTLSPTPVYTNDTITAAVTTSDSDGDPVSLSYAWSVDNTVVLEGVDEASLAGTSFFSKGQTVLVSVTPDDGFGAGNSAASSTLTVLNTAPTAPSLAFSSPAPRSGLDDVTCLIDTPSTDDDSDSLSYSFSWLLNGSPWNGATTTTVHNGDTISANETGTGQVWTCEAVPNDAEVDGPSSSISVSILVADTDGDGVLDSEDLCPGYDDFNDANSNSLPDDCEQSTTFNYTGAPQTFTVPSDVTLVHIECWGASGWSGSNNGGQGGLGEGLLTVSPAEELYVYVGGEGTTSIGSYNPQGGGWNGGGDGQNNGSSQTVGGGGGASDVRLHYSTNPLDSTSLSSRVVVAGGGGGTTNNGGAYGGHGGGLQGNDGGQHSNNHRATGGTQSAGGSANAGFGYGGSGNGSMTPWNGGGGGGWYGGGTSTAHSGGAGGSSYVGGLDSGAVSTSGHTGNGIVTITWSQP